MTRLPLLLAAYLAATLQADSNEGRAIGPRVVEFARSRLGERVGGGECSELADEALRYAGAGRPGRGWGVERASIREAEPGDIVQFEGCVFVARRVLPNGIPARVTYTAERHTAIVAAVREGRGRLVLGLYHQNAGFLGDDEARRRVVSAWTLDLATMRRGTVRAYRPVRSEAAAPGSRTGPDEAPGGAR